MCPWLRGSLFKEATHYKRYYSLGCLPTFQRFGAHSAATLGSSSRLPVHNVGSSLKSRPPNSGQHAGTQDLVAPSSTAVSPSSPPSSILEPKYLDAIETLNAHRLDWNKISPDFKSHIVQFLHALISPIPSSEPAIHDNIKHILHGGPERRIPPVTTDLISFLLKEGLVEPATRLTTVVVLLHLKIEPIGLTSILTAARGKDLSDDLLRDLGKLLLNAAGRRQKSPGYMQSLQRCITILLDLHFRRNAYSEVVRIFNLLLNANIPPSPESCAIVFRSLAARRRVPPNGVGEGEKLRTNQILKRFNSFLNQVTKDGSVPLSEETYAVLLREVAVVLSARAPHGRFVTLVEDWLALFRTTNDSLKSHPKSSARAEFLLAAAEGMLSWQEAAKSTLAHRWTRPVQLERARERHDCVSNTLHEDYAGVMADLKDMREERRTTERRRDVMVRDCLLRTDVLGALNTWVEDKQESTTGRQEPRRNPGTLGRICFAAIDLGDIPLLAQALSHTSILATSPKVFADLWRQALFSIFHPTRQPTWSEVQPMLEAFVSVMGDCDVIGKSGISSKGHRAFVKPIFQTHLTSKFFEVAATAEDFKHLSHYIKRLRLPSSDHAVRQVEKSLESLPESIGAKATQALDFWGTFRP